MRNKIFSAIREIFSEPGPDGTLSWGRVASAVSLVAAISWVTHIVIKTHTLPALDGATGFIVGPYASNKIATAAQAFANKGNNQ